MASGTVLPAPFIQDADNYGFRNLQDRAGRAPRIIKAIHLLFVKSAQELRKNKPVYARVHSEDVAEDFIMLATNLLSDQDLTAGIIAALLHDNVEDFNTTYKEIREHAGCKAAFDVSAMTTPLNERLARLYPVITNDYFDTARLSDQSPKTYRRAIKKFAETTAGTDAYEKFKSRLKLEFKIDRAKHFNFYQAIVKAIDNLNSLKEYTKEFEAGYVIITQDGGLGPARRIANGAPLVLSRTEAERNIRDRETYHDAVMARIGALAKEAKNKSLAQDKSANYDIAIEILDAYFYSVKGAMLRHIDKASYAAQAPVLKAA